MQYESCLEGVYKMTQTSLAACKNYSQVMSFHFKVNFFVAKDSKGQELILIWSYILYLNT